VAESLRGTRILVVVRTVACWHEDFTVSLVQHDAVAMSHHRGIRGDS
jgi:hypothetical protein